MESQLYSLLQKGNEQQFKDTLKTISKDEKIEMLVEALSACIINNGDIRMRRKISRAFPSSRKNDMYAMTSAQISLHVAAQSKWR